MKDKKWTFYEWANALSLGVHDSYYNEGESVGDIAIKFNLSEGTVKDMLFIREEEVLSELPSLR